MRAILVVAILARLAAIGGAVARHRPRPRAVRRAFSATRSTSSAAPPGCATSRSAFPIHSADLIYAYDDYSYTHYLYVLAFDRGAGRVRSLRLKSISAAMYLGGAVVLFRLAPARLRQRRRAGGAAGPALPAQSVRVVDRGAEGAAVLPDRRAGMRRSRSATMRTRSFARRVARRRCPCAWRPPRLQSIRDGGLIIAILGLGGGRSLGWLGHRPRAAVAFAVLAPLVVFGLLSRPAVQLRAAQEVRRAAKLHWGHVNTPGYSLQDPGS